MNNYEGTHELVTAPTAWESAPTFIRFALWIWAIFIVGGFIVGATWALVVLAALVIQ